VEKFNLGGFPDERIISIAQKEMAADQRLREAKEAVDQRLPESQDRRSGAGDVSPDQPTDQSDEPRPDDADGLPTEGSLKRTDQSSTRRSSTRSSSGSNSAMR